MAAATAYEFEGLLRISRAAGANSHTTSNLFAGTATLSQILGLARANGNDDAAILAPLELPFAVATATVVKAASTSTTEQIYVHVRGTLVTSAGGTFIPQFKYSAAPGGAPSVLKGTFFIMRAIDANPQGTWA